MNETRKNRVAIYGGSFDPVHVAHLEMALACVRNANLDRLIFVPASRSPFKRNNPIASDLARIEMLKVATKDYPNLETSTYELDRGGVSYSFDTAAAFKECFTHSDLFWVIGGDQFEQLHKWHRIEALGRLVTFLVVARPGYLKSPKLWDDLSYECVEAPSLHISSSDIRERIEKGLSLSGLVPTAVEELITAKQYYSAC